MAQADVPKKPIFFGWDRVAVSIAPAVGGLITVPFAMYLLLSAAILAFTIGEHKYPARYQAVAASAGD